MKKYIETGRIKVDKSIHEDLTTVHDPCNYGRKSMKAFGEAFFEEPRWVTQQCCENYVEMHPNRMNNFCCGAGGGNMWYEMDQGDRINVARFDQLQASGADIIATACSFCAIMLDDAAKVRGLDERVKVLDLAELVARSMAG